MAMSTIRNLIPVILCALVVLGLMDPETGRKLYVIWSVWCMASKRQFADCAWRLGVEGIRFWLF